MTSLRDRVVRAVEGARGAVVILSENPIHDTGGGQRSAQLTSELLERDSAVLFVSRGVVTETVDLGLTLHHPRLVRMSIEAVSSPDGRAAVAALLASPGAAVVTQVPVRAWLPVLEMARDADAVSVYDCMDPWESDLGRGWYQRADEELTARASDVLLASSVALVERVESMTERETHLVPNACDERTFRRDESWARPDDLPGGERVALFVGALWGGWMDWGLVRSVAEGCPEVAFAFVGDHRREGAAMPENCSFLGLKAHAELPPYLAHAEVAFLPWRVDDRTNAMSPITVYEHVAMGLPVVATPIEPLNGVPGVVTAPDAKAFTEALRSTGRSTLTEGDLGAMARFSAESSWAGRVDRILALVEEDRDRRPVEARRTGPAVKTRTMLSVVVPSYNHEDYVGEAVDSVRDQSLPAGELLVIDDGSGDSTLDVLAEHSFARMRCIRQRNRGAHATINRAIALSQGDYVAILNSDDVYEPERLEHAWGVANETRAALVFGSVRLIDGSGRPLSREHETARWYARARDEVGRAPSLAAGVRRENIAVTTSNFFVHRELWRRLGGFRDYRYVHDYDFLLRALQLCPGRVVYAEELDDVRYRVHGDNTIAEDVDRALEERARMLREVGRPGRRVRSALRLAPGSRAVGAAVDSTPMPGPVERLLPPASASPRVGIVVPSLGAGGLEEVVALLAESLSGRGIETSVLCTDHGGEVGDRLRNAGISVTVGEGRPDAWRAWRDRVAPDVLSSHFVAGEAVEVLAKGGVPVVETVHNTYAWFTEADWAREGQKRSLLAAVVAVSDVVARYYDVRCPGDPPTRVVPNAVHPARAARVPRGYARRRLELTENDPVFVHLGRITSQKNLPGLLAAFADVLQSLPSARLLLVGPDDDAGSVATLTRAHAELFRRGAVRHVPPVRAVGTVLCAADAYASNSFYEGWSVAASEALWVGLPLVSSEVGGATELVGADGARGYVVPNAQGDPLAVTDDRLREPPEHAVGENRAALTEALRDVVARRDEWSGRADDIRAYARTSLAPERMAEDYARIFREVLARS